MRTIKFRGKVKYNGQHFFSGEWVEGFYAYKELTGTHLILVERAETQRYASYFVEVEVDSETLVQFTGLLDKNGVEIFDGDILEELKGYHFEVLWDEKNAGFKLNWITKAYQYPEWNRGVLMNVIRNIHEVPHGTMDFDRN